MTGIVDGAIASGFFAHPASPMAAAATMIFPRMFSLSNGVVKLLRSKLSPAERAHYLKGLF
ncbi:protein of unknown function [Nitratireductor aquimarinus]